MYLTSRTVLFCFRIRVASVHDLLEDLQVGAVVDSSSSRGVRQETLSLSILSELNASEEQSDTSSDEETRSGLSHEDQTRRALRQQVEDTETSLTCRSNPSGLKYFFNKCFLFLTDHGARSIPVCSPCVRSNIIR